MPYKELEKRREAVRKSCKKAYWANPEKKRAAMRACYEKNREKRAAYSRRRYLENPELSRAYQKAWRKAHPESDKLTKRRAMLKAHGLTIEDYDRMLTEQKGLCKICGQPETTKKHGKVQSLSVEHCHITSRVRGLTCNRCNRGMGMFSDDPALLRAAAAHLEASAPG